MSLPVPWPAHAPTFPYVLFLFPNLICLLLYVTLIIDPHTKKSAEDLKMSKNIFVTNLPPNFLSSLCADGFVFLPPMPFLVYDQFCRIPPHSS